MEPQDYGKTAQEVGRDSQTLEEASRRQEGLPREQPKGAIQFPTWRYAKDGRTKIVNDPLELEELEADGGDWRDAPHPADTQFVPNGTRTFEAPVGTVGPRGEIARLDRPGPEVAVTTALPRNVAGSVPSEFALDEQRRAESTRGGSSVHPTQGVIARLQTRIQELERENGDLKTAAQKAKHTDKSGKDSRSASAKKKGSKGKGQSEDAREAARKQAEIDQRGDAAAKAADQSRVVNQS